MLTPLSGELEPMRVRGLNLFVDWRFVDPGMVTWTTDGQPLAIFDEPGDKTLGEPSGPWGIRLEAQKAELVGPVLNWDQPWELNYNMYFATALYDEGVYRAWYSCVPNGAVDRWAAGQLLCYAESDNGFDWRKPELAYASFGDHARTNIVYGGSISPNGFQSGSIFIDPSAPAEERYKLFYLGEIPTADIGVSEEQYRDRFGNDIDPLCFRKGRPHHFTPGAGEPGSSLRQVVKMMAGAVSHDGLDWKPVEEPLMATYSDTLNTASWDPIREKYVGYFRTWRYGRRAIGRAETTDFRHWPETPTTVLEAGLDWPAGDDIYTNSKTLYPGSESIHVMFPGVFHRFDDGRDVHLASSVDGESWRWVPGGEVVSRGELDSWCAGDLNPGYGLVPLDQERIALPVMAYSRPHKYPRGGNEPLGAMGWATWKEGRISAIVADERGGFSTPLMVFEGSSLSLNLKTKQSGKVQVEIRDEQGRPIKGFTFQEADPIVADSIRHAATWEGRTDLTSLAGRPIVLVFRLRGACLYGFEFVPVTQNGRPAAKV